MPKARKPLTDKQRIDKLLEIEEEALDQVLSAFKSEDKEHLTDLVNNLGEIQRLITKCSL